MLPLQRLYFTSMTINQSENVATKRLNRSVKTTNSHWRERAVWMQKWEWETQNACVVADTLHLTVSESLTWFAFVIINLHLRLYVYKIGLYSFCPHRYCLWDAHHLRYSSSIAQLPRLLSGFPGGDQRLVCVHTDKTQTETPSGSLFQCSRGHGVSLGIVRPKAGGTVDTTVLLQFCLCRACTRAEQRSGPRGRRGHWLEIQSEARRRGLPRGPERGVWAPGGTQGRGDSGKLTVIGYNGVPLVMLLSRPQMMLYALKLWGQRGQRGQGSHLHAKTSHFLLARRRDFRFRREVTRTSAHGKSRPLARC